ncbi:hypothetical protein ACLBWX_20880 [Methylobacterium sp. M6A4_1b]
MAEYLDLGSKTLEIADSSIGRSFVGDEVEQGPSKDRVATPADWPEEVRNAAYELDQLDLFPGLPGLCEHSMVMAQPAEDTFHFKDRKDCEPSVGTVAPRDKAAKNEGLALGFDSRIETGLPRVTTPARPFPKRPQRVADRPRSEEWNDDELLTLPEAAALFWPDGPITTNTLRTAGRDGALAITKVAGKFFTTPTAIRRMGEDGVGEKSKQPEADEMSAFPTLQMKIAEAQRLGGGRARSRRAAKGPVTTAANGGSGR